MTKRARWWLLGSGAVIAALVALAVGSGSSDVPVAARPRVDAAADATRDAPDEATVRARKLRALRQMVARRAPVRPVQVRVVDCHHAAAVGAEVEAFAGDAHPSAIADDAGIARLEIPLDAESVHVVARGGGEAVGVEHRGEVVAAPADATIEVAICPGATVVGTVRDEQGRALAGALVKLGDDFTETEADGEFALTDVWLDATSLRVEHVIGAVETSLGALGAGEERRIDVTLEVGRRVSGVVVGGDGVGVANVAVSVQDVAGTVAAETRTDRNGRFWFKHVVVMPLSVVAEGGALGVAEVMVGGDAPAESLVLRFAATGTLVATWNGEDGWRLVATPDAAPWESPFPRDENPRALSLESAVAVTVAAPRVWRVAVRRGDEERECGSGLVMPGQRLDLRCGQPGTAEVTARIVDENGKAVAGTWFIWTEVRGDDGSPHGQLDTGGRLHAHFALPGVSMMATLTVEGPGKARIDRRTFKLAPGDHIDLGDLVMLSEAAVAARFPDDPHAPFGGVGARLQSTPLGVMLTNIARDGPLDAAGIAPGDSILAIDGASAAMPNFDATKLMRGAPGSTVHLQLLRNNSDLFEVDIERQMFDAQNADWLD